MASSYYFVTIAILALASIVLVHASDPSPLQDFCVAANDSMSAGIYSLSLILIFFSLFNQYFFCGLKRNMKILKF